MQWMGGWLYRIELGAGGWLYRIELKLLSMKVHDFTLPCKTGQNVCYTVWCHTGIYGCTVEILLFNTVILLFILK